MAGWRSAGLDYSFMAIWGFRVRQAPYREEEDMKKLMTWGVIMLLAGSVSIGAGCVQKGPAQRAGEDIDQAVEDMKDAVDPPGPAEKAGRSIDRTVDDLSR